MTQNSIQMISSAVSDRGLNEKRAHNEDSYLEMPEHGLFAVADGVGGAQAGDVASQMAMEILAEAFNNLRAGGDVEEMMSIAISRANGAIYQMSHDLPQLSTMATTIVALQVTQNIATIGHAGDSRLYRLDSKGNLFRETQDHSVVEEEVRAGRMTPEQAENHPSKNVISRALGAENTVEVDLKTIMFEPNTTFLLCSDGITRHITDVEIRELLALPHPPVLICQQMKDICYERGAEDNLTAVIVRLSAPETAQISDFEENTVPATREVAITQPDIDDAPTQNLEMPKAAQTFEDPTHISIPANQPPVNTMTILGDNSGQSVKSNYENDVISAQTEPKQGGGFFGKFLLFLLGLLLGGALGAGGYYYWLTTQPTPEPQVPQLTKTEYKNIPFETFEKARRDVDANPTVYLAKFGSSAEDAEGFYLNGRAQILMEKYEEALKTLAKAKEMLEEYKGENKATLQNEIAFATASITSLESTKKIENDKTKNNQIVPNSNISTNETKGSSNANSGKSNSAGNANKGNSNSSSNANTK
ncbi:MAG TPA: protein phosphatase 2C domain-containing protein [Pyrinomonadaceae bacterium]|nr:protein phosphatase 2C domain-containing protein [Pyrinomonadaceae bacterium]